MKHLSLLFLLVCSLSVSLYAQNFNVYDNKDSLKAYLQSDRHPIDPNAAVVVLYEIGTSEVMNGITSYKYEIAYKVFNAKKIGDFADIIIPKFKSGIIRKLKGSTFNYENGEIKESKVEKSDIIFDKYVDKIKLIKFSMPAIKDGSVVTYTYIYESGILPRRWEFQKSYPVLYSRFEFNIPSKIVVTPMMNATIALEKFIRIKKLDASACEACYCEDPIFYQDITRRVWIRRNVPAIKEEILMGPKQQYVESAKVSIKGFYRNDIYIPDIGSWDTYSKDKWYGKWLAQAFLKNDFLKVKVDELTNNSKDSLEKAKLIFYYVQKNIQENVKEEDIAKVLAAKQGSDVGINKLLCAMLRKAGLESDLVVLSKKGEDMLNEFVPNPEDATNVVVRLVINDVHYLLDAVQKTLPFGYLTTDYYNGYARIVNKNGGSIELDPAMAINAVTNTVYISSVNEEQSNIFKFRHLSLQNS
ncbi:hypothetical protein DBR32_04300 [Taibaiella sp. KBW10]|uniref:DUF3857 domain-containing protein n=1 Tax=Taibaiella sp. KBW10 TaxID=2153357 RepID=UPI000F59F66F|nr:DUF3857 domain-containing protein [Taibaiella sp. KBW10]RQO32028.1 hypothetical protein DBR32_04300 [Taibaiella sp. KBW10]